MAGTEQQPTEDFEIKVVPNGGVVVCKNYKSFAAFTSARDFTAWFNDQYPILYGSELRDGESYCDARDRVAESRRRFHDEYESRPTPPAFVEPPASAVAEAALSDAVDEHPSDNTEAPVEDESDQDDEEKEDADVVTDDEEDDEDEDVSTVPVADAAPHPPTTATIRLTLLQKKILGHIAKAVEKAGGEVLIGSEFFASKFDIKLESAQNHIRRLGSAELIEVRVTASGNFLNMTPAGLKAIRSE